MLLLRKTTLMGEVNPLVDISSTYLKVLGLLKIYYLVMSQNSSKNISLEVGEDRVLLKSRPNLFYLDIDLPFLLNSEETGSQFNRQSKVLTVTIPVTGIAPV